MSQGGHDEQLVPDAMLRLGNALAFSKEAAQQEEGLQYLYKGLKLAEACYNIEGPYHCPAGNPWQGIDCCKAL